MTGSCTTSQIILLVVLLGCIMGIILWVYYRHYHYRHYYYMTPENLLIRLQHRVQLLLKHLAQNHPHDPRVKRLLKRSLRTRIQPSQTAETFTMNKGESIHICLQKGDLNTFMFVLIHEMAHVMSLSTHHTPEFWSNFKFLLREAARVHIYTPVDYTHTPVSYCAMKITSNPYFKNMTDQEWREQIQRAIYVL